MAVGACRRPHEDQEVAAHPGVAGALRRAEGSPCSAAADRSCRDGSDLFATPGGVVTQSSLGTSEAGHLMEGNRLVTCTFLCRGGGSRRRGQLLRRCTLRLPASSHARHTKTRNGCRRAGLRCVGVAGFEPTASSSRTLSGLPGDLREPVDSAGQCVGPGLDASVRVGPAFMIVSQGSPQRAVHAASRSRRSRLGPAGPLLHSIDDTKISYWSRWVANGIHMGAVPFAPIIVWVRCGRCRWWCGRGQRVGRAGRP